MRRASCVVMETRALLLGWILSCTSTRTCRRLCCVITKAYHSMSKASSPMIDSLAKHTPQCHLLVWTDDSMTLPSKLPLDIRIIFESTTHVQSEHLRRFIPSINLDNLCRVTRRVRPLLSPYQMHKTKIDLHSTRLSGTFFHGCAFNIRVHNQQHLFCTL